MPIYEYECDACGIRFERTQRIMEDPLKTCPECSGRVHRVLQPVGIIFKGSGFYVTDHKASSPTAVPGESKFSGSDSAPKAAEKAERKEESSAPAATPAKAD